MTTISALQGGLLGIQRGLKGLERNAAAIASADQFNSTSPGDLAAPMVGLLEHRLYVQASAKVVKTVSETIGTLIDITA